LRAPSNATDCRVGFVEYFNLESRWDCYPTRTKATRNSLPKFFSKSRQFAISFIFSHHDGELTVFVGGKPQRFASDELVAGERGTNISMYR
jgi:hypothetical protein